MADYAMPICCINMGSDMVYILEQRLEAQSISVEKTRRVLSDVCSTMFSKKFIDDLFKPQIMYSAFFIRQIFNRLAHSSIMRLNETSMDKLYDLMTMGQKYQVMMCRDPIELICATLNHMDNVINMLKKVNEEGKAYKLALRTKKLVVKTYSNMSVEQLHNIRQALFLFLQDRKVKVSLFLTEKIQNQDGTIVKTHHGLLPWGTEVPGAIKTFGEDSYTREDTLRLGNRSHVATIEWRPEFDKPKSFQTKLGRNLYKKDKPPEKSVPSTRQKIKVSKIDVKRELDDLAKRVGSRNSGVIPSLTMVDLSIDVAEGDTSNLDDALPDLSITLNDSRNAKLVRAMTDLTVEDEEIGSGEENDLLNLMDG